MAYIKERGNNNYFVRVSCGTLDNGRTFSKITPVSSFKSESARIESS